MMEGWERRTASSSGGATWKPRTLMSSYVIMLAKNSDERSGEVWKRAEGGQDEECKRTFFRSTIYQSPVLPFMYAISPV